MALKKLLLLNTYLKRMALERALKITFSSCSKMRKQKNPVLALNNTRIHLYMYKNEIKKPVIIMTAKQSLSIFSFSN